MLKPPVNKPNTIFPATDTEALDVNELEVVKKYSPLYPDLHWNRNTIENGFSKEHHPDILTCPLCRATTEQRYTRLLCSTLSGLSAYLAVRQDGFAPIARPSLSMRRRCAQNFPKKIATWRYLPSRYGTMTSLPLLKRGTEVGYFFVPTMITQVPSSSLSLFPSVLGKSRKRNRKI